LTQPSPSKRSPPGPGFGRALVLRLVAKANRWSPSVRQWLDPAGASSSPSRKRRARMWVPLGC